jgi:hypothetical protein
MKPTIRHVSAVLRLPKRVKNIGAYAQAILSALTGNASLPAPTPALATVEGDLAAYNTAV